MYEDEDEDEDVHDRLQDILTLTLFQRIITYLASEPVRQASRSKRARNASLTLFFLLYNNIWL
jgi:hypothetical protein